MKLKKLTALLLALVMLVSLTGCTFLLEQLLAATETPESGFSDLPLVTDAPEKDDPAGNLPVIQPEQKTDPAPAEPKSDPEPAQSAPSEPAKPEPAPSEPEPQNEPEPEPAVVEDGTYYDAEHVVLYLHTFGHLPSNYITKNEARKLGWEGGTPEKFREGAAIGGDHYGNYEGILPKTKGVSYTECDLETLGAKSRGAKRLIFSSDGRYYYTEDHYEHFTELVVTEEGEVQWKN